MDELCFQRVHGSSTPHLLFSDRMLFSDLDIFGLLSSSTLKSCRLVVDEMCSAFFSLGNSVVSFDAWRGKSSSRRWRLHVLNVCRHINAAVLLIVPSSPKTSCLLQSSSCFHKKDQPWVRFPTLRPC